MIREINVTDIISQIEEMCIKANKVLPSDIERAIKSCKNCEKNSLANSILSDLEKNIQIAKNENLPICQDTGMAVIFLEIGQDVHFVGGNLYDAINEGVRRGYINGFLRKSVVGDPLRRVNTNDNTPAVIHSKIVDGNRVKITVAPKGFGSENMSSIKMLTPTESREGVIKTVIDTVKKASSNPCPPIVVGVGIGGDFEECAILSKKALCRDISVRSNDEYYAQLETEILTKINELQIGPQGFGGDTTALAVNIEYAPTHIAGLPVAINIGCHVTRHITVEV